MTDNAVNVNGTKLDESPLFLLLEGFVTELRAAGLPVSLVENIDAAQAVRHIPLEDRDAFKYALAATLVKNNAHWRTFETLFEVYFSLRGAEYALGDEAADPLAELDMDMDQQDQAPPGQGGQGGGDGLSPEELAELLYQALMRGDEALMRAIAKQAVKRYAGMEPGRPVGGTYYLYRTLRNLDLDGMMERLMEQARDSAPEGLTPLEERLENDEYETGSRNSRKRLKPRSGVASLPTVVRRPWPKPCASRCPKMSTSCTPAGRRWRTFAVPSIR